ncbi:MAG: iron-containing alcohol dehydrogenase, partial [Myxococcales bacterium]|nr:iron-containing alcohol dehydrogenase [Myxococcales bacterium]
LNRAGFGDLLSKPYSNADWLLSHLVRDVPYSSAPSDLLDDVFARLLDSARAVGRADHDGLTVLMECILLSGFSMTIAGSSAPASGGEHLISHYWDMEQFDRGLPLHGLHGTQVGIATRLSALLFERLVALEARDIHPVQCAQRRPDKAWLDRLGDVHDTLSAPVVAELRDQLAQKQLVAGELRAELERVRDRWPEIREKLRAVLMPAAEITEALRAAGCPDRASRIGVDAARAVKTLRVCRHMRNRYVAFDLMDDLGLLEGWAEAVVAETEAPDASAP